MKIIEIEQVDDYYNLKGRCWCCDFIFEEVEKNNKQQEFMKLLEETFPKGIETIELNDYLRFEGLEILKQLNILKGV